ncbi:hypothetical protein HDV05_007487 [Chytridiales sp. JEL 0842]|nr:hypothetical protein HDV05_007487 [Chytridiales sp. JEL 0842]
MSTPEPSSQPSDLRVTSTPISIEDSTIPSATYAPSPHRSSGVFNRKKKLAMAQSNPSLSVSDPATPPFSSTPSSRSSSVKSFPASPNSNGRRKSVRGTEVRDDDDDHKPLSAVKWSLFNRGSRSVYTAPSKEDEGMKAKAEMGKSSWGFRMNSFLKGALRNRFGAKSSAKPKESAEEHVSDSKHSVKKPVVVGPPQVPLHNDVSRPKRPHSMAVTSAEYRLPRSASSPTNENGRTPTPPAVSKPYANRLSMDAALTSALYKQAPPQPWIGGLKKSTSATNISSPLVPANPSTVDDAAKGVKGNLAMRRISLQVGVEGSSALMTLLESSSDEDDDQDDDEDDEETRVDEDLIPIGKLKSASLSETDIDTIPIGKYLSSSTSLNSLTGTPRSASPISAATSNYSPIIPTTAATSQNRRNRTYSEAKVYGAKPSALTPRNSSDNFSASTNHMNPTASNVSKSKRLSSYSSTPSLKTNQNDGNDLKATLASFNIITSSNNSARRSSKVLSVGYPSPVMAAYMPSVTPIQTSSTTNVNRRKSLLDPGPQSPWMQSEPAASPIIPGSSPKTPQSAPLPTGSPQMPIAYYPVPNPTSAPGSPQIPMAYYPMMYYPQPGFPPVPTQSKNGLQSNSGPFITFSEEEYITSKNLQNAVASAVALKDKKGTARKRGSHHVKKEKRRLSMQQQDRIPPVQ